MPGLCQSLELVPPRHGCHAAKGSLAQRQRSHLRRVPTGQKSWSRARRSQAQAMLRLLEQRQRQAWACELRTALGEAALRRSAPQREAPHGARQEEARLPHRLLYVIHDPAERRDLGELGNAYG